MVKKRILMLAEEQKFGLIMQIRQNLTQVFAFLAFLKIALLSVSRNTPGLDRGEFDLFSTGTSTLGTYPKLAYPWKINRRTVTLHF